MSSANLLLVKGAISELSEEEQGKVFQCAANLRSMVEGNGAAGMIALVLVTAEMDSES